MQRKAPGDTKGEFCLWYQYGWALTSTSPLKKKRLICGAGQPSCSSWDQGLQNTSPVLLQSRGKRVGWDWLASVARRGGDITRSGSNRCLQQPHSSRTLPRARAAGGSQGASEGTAES